MVFYEVETHTHGPSQFCHTCVSFYDIPTIYLRYTYDIPNSFLFFPSFLYRRYSDEWQVEAAKRGLFNLKNTVDAVDTLASDKNKTLFDSMGVWTPAEVEARQETQYDQYICAITIESDCLIKMMDTGALPACAQDLNSMQVRERLYNLQCKTRVCTLN